MKLDQALKILANLSLMALLASCAPSSKDLNSYQAAETSDQSSIIGGVTANSDFEMKNGIVGVYDLEKGGLCTGSIIGDGLVLTAGHCANVDHPEKMIIFFGTNFNSVIAQVRKGDHSNIRLVVAVVRHEKYVTGDANIADDNHQTKNDISLVRFNGDLATGFKKATLATSAQSQMLKQGSSVMLAGYGLSEFKQDPSTGQALSSKGAGTLREVDNIKVLSILPTGEEITFDQSTGRGACHGDSGGPAYLVDAKTNTNYVVGVTSRGGGDCNVTAVYTGVLGYSQWIQDHSAQLMK